MSNFSYADPISNLRNGDNDDDYDDDSEETESSSEVEWNSTGYEPAVNHEDFELGRSFFDIVKDELPSELYSKFIEFCKSINKSITISYDTSHIISARSNWTVWIKNFKILWRNLPIQHIFKKKLWTTKISHFGLVWSFQSIAKRSKKTNGKLL